MSKQFLDILKESIRWYPSVNKFVIVWKDESDLKDSISKYLKYLSVLGTINNKTKFNSVVKIVEVIISGSIGESGIYKSSFIKSNLNGQRYIYLSVEEIHYLFYLENFRLWRLDKLLS